MQEYKEFIPMYLNELYRQQDGRYKTFYSKSVFFMDSESMFMMDRNKVSVDELYNTKYLRSKLATAAIDKMWDFDGSFSKDITSLCDKLLSEHKKDPRDGKPLHVEYNEEIDNNMGDYIRVSTCGTHVVIIVKNNYGNDVYVNGTNNDGNYDPITREKLPDDNDEAKKEKNIISCLSTTILILEKRFGVTEAQKHFSDLYKCFFAYQYLFRG